MKIAHIAIAVPTLRARGAKLPYSVSRAALLACSVSLLMLGAACTTTERVTQARPVMRNATPSNVSEMRIAETALDSGNLELATSLYERIVKADPRSVQGLTGLGNTLYAVGDYTRAGVYYDHASQLDANAPAPLIGHARVAIHQRRFDDAIATYRRLLAMTPNEPLALAGLGAAIDLSGDHAGAQAVLREGLSKNPGDPMLSVNLGLSLILGGNPREGANVLLDVTRYPAAPTQARQDLALAYGLLGNMDAAAEILGHDLPKASVQDNLRFYEIQRERLGLHPGADAGAAKAASVPGVPVQAASLR
ncbi:tetratricopeptide repeat protein [Paraburkholderia dilworthii]|uniref:tetratricopeptide repeat protein n=1 Tax=Paraburkholderia dilworthii TaxID=948106 RepID=UPI0003F5B172|nr:tetratricopeptide repeat protein [Paraburkholderia dilworthii]